MKGLCDWTQKITGPKQQLCVYNQQTTSSTVLTMILKVGIKMIKVLKNMKIKLTETSRPSSPSSCVCSKIKAIQKEKEKEKLPEDSSFTQLIMNDG